MRIMSKHVLETVPKGFGAPKGFGVKLKRLAQVAATGLTLLLAPAVLAAEVAAEVAQEVAQEYVLGTHYEELPVAVPASEDGKLEVVEVFSYMCIHCFNFDAPVSVWAERQAEDVQFRREPAVFNRDWALLAQSFYTAQALGVSDKTHEPVFEAIHTHKQDLRDPAKMAALFKQFADVEEADFMQAYESFSVRSKVQQANSRGRQYRVSAVPALIVAGKYKVDGRMAGSNTGMLNVTKFLLEKERAAQKESAESP